VVVSLCGGQLLEDGLFMSVVSQPLEALAFELGEPDAVGGVVERLPVGLADAFALALGQFGEQVAHAVNTAVLAVGGEAVRASLCEVGAGG
jgi:hypothetical protein